MQESKRQRQVGGGEKGARDEKLASAHESEDEEQSLFDIVKGGKTALRVCMAIQSYTSGLNSNNLISRCIFRLEIRSF